MPSSLAASDRTTVQQCGLSQSNERLVAESRTCLETHIAEAHFVTSVLSPNAFTALGAWMLSRNPGRGRQSRAFRCSCGGLGKLFVAPQGGIVVQLNCCTNRFLVATALLIESDGDRHRAPHGRCVDQLRRERLALITLMEMDGNCWRRAICWGRSLCPDPKTTLRPDGSGCGSSQAPSALAVLVSNLIIGGDIEGHGCVEQVIQLVACIELLEVVFNEPCQSHHLFSDSRFIARQDVAGDIVDLGPVFRQQVYIIAEHEAAPVRP